MLLVLAWEDHLRSLEQYLFLLVPHIQRDTLLIMQL
jgi:hypothetical protein